LNRVDDIIVFRPLTKPDLKNIIDIELSKVYKRLKEKNLRLVLTEESKDLLIEKGTSLDFGARPLRRAIEHFLEDPLSEDLLRGSFVGKNLINTRVAEIDGEKKILFDPSFEAEDKEVLEPVGPSSEAPAKGSESKDS
jgi:ATP-dependent Clp protease ATP-binding subunit ClpC